jgi:hypothetical protein
LQGLERPHGPIRGHYVDRFPSLGTGQYLGPLVGAIERYRMQLADQTAQLFTGPRAPQGHMPDVIAEIDLVFDHPVGTVNAEGSSRTAIPWAPSRGVVGAGQVHCFAAQPPIARTSERGRY